MFHARHLCLFFIVLFLSLQVNEGICQMKYSISKEMYMGCAEAIATYVKKTRNWNKGSYEIRFSGIHELRNSATFGVTSNAVIEEIKKRKNEPGHKLFHHPDDFSVIVDIVDYVVLSENTLDTVFPNAKPEYKHPFPDKNKK